MGGVKRPNKQFAGVTCLTSKLAMLTHVLIEWLNSSEAKLALLLSSCSLILGSGKVGILSMSR